MPEQTRNDGYYINPPVRSGEYRRVISRELSAMAIVEIEADKFQRRMVCQ